MSPLEGALSVFMKTNPTCNGCGGKSFVTYSVTHDLGGPSKGVFACLSCTLMTKHEWGGGD